MLGNPLLRVRMILLWFIRGLLHHLGAFGPVR